VVLLLVIHVLVIGAIATKTQGVIGGGRAPCQCENHELCRPITAAPRKEMFVFQLNEGDWKYYDWSFVTTMGAFGTWDPQMLCTAHAHNARVVLAATYFDVSQLRNWTYMTAWMNTNYQRVADTNADGINLDIEDPIDTSQTPYLTELVQNFTAFIREKLPYSQVTYDVAWSPNCIDGRCYDYLAISKIVDFVFVMDYDMRSQIWGPCVASANSPPQLGHAGMANFTSMGIPPSKLVLGLPWYGYDYPCIGMSNNDTVCSITPVPFRGVNCSDAAGREKNFSILKELLKNSTTGPRWDATLQSPWFNYLNPTTKQMHQVWYDDPTSLKIKTTWAREQGLRGVGMWTGDFVDYDTPNNQDTKEMWDAMRAFF
jgi:di-N-acetylchitobiase